MQRNLPVCLLSTSALLLGVSACESRDVAPAERIGTVEAAISHSTAVKLPQKNVTFFPGEVIVKLKDSAMTSAPVDTASFQGMPAFQGRHRIKRSKRIFSDNGTVGSKQFEKHVASVKAKFPVRTLRATGAGALPRIDTIYKLTIEDTAGDIEALCTELQKDSRVEYAVPNRLVRLDSVPNDPLFPQQWSHQVTSAVSAWDVEKGKPEVADAKKAFPRSCAAVSGSWGIQYDTRTKQFLGFTTR